MHLNPQFIMRKIADETLLISIQDITAPKKLLVLNELAADIYTYLQQGKSKQEIHSSLLEMYDIDPVTLENDMNDFFSELISYGVLI